MKIDPRISAELARLEPNQIGVLAWSLMANPAHAGASLVNPNLITHSLPNRVSRPYRTSRHPRPWPDP